MRFGKTYREQRDDRVAAWRREKERRSTQTTRFAWLPIKLDTGEKVWLERYHQQETWVDCPTCWDTDGWWEMKRWA